MSDSRKISARYKTFFGFVVLVFIANLLIFNDVLSILDGVEAQTLFTSSFFLNIPTILYQYILNEFGVHEFMLRLPSTFILLIVLGGFYKWGLALFGEQQIFYTLTVVMSAFLIVNVAKFALLDIWIMSVQVLYFITFVRYIKQSNTQWLFLNNGILFAGAFIAPVHMLIFSIVLNGYFYWIHPQGKNIIALKNWLVWLLLLVFIFINREILPTYAWNNSTKFLLYTFLGFLPWIGFFFGAWADWYKKFRQREEMTIILGGGLLASMADLSLTFSFVVSMMIALQLKNYFNPKYPFKDVVRAIPVLQMVVVFCLACYSLMYSFVELEAAGYRAMMIASLMYWIPLFGGIIGLFGMNKHWMITGMTFSGILFTLMFWMQIMPLRINYYNAGKQAVLEAKENPLSTNQSFVFDENERKGWQLYAIDENKKRGNPEINGTLSIQMIGNESIKDSTNLIIQKDFLTQDKKVFKINY